jgi:hypothetical protein
VTATDRSSRLCEIIAGIATAESIEMMVKTITNSINETPRLDLKVFRFVSDIMSQELVIRDLREMRYSLGTPDRRGGMGRTSARERKCKGHTETARPANNEGRQPTESLREAGITR